MASRIHPTAFVDPAARIAGDVEIGPYCIVGPAVQLSSGCRLESHVVMDGETRIGENCRFSPFSSIGGRPQDLKYAGEKTRLEIGSGNTFRESCTIHIGTDGGGGVTRIGDDNYFMAYVHIAHDCHIGNRTLFGNAATLGGHVTVEDEASVGAFCGVHQFCRIGHQAFVAGYSVVTQDALPYVITVGNRAATHGINVIGLKRRGAPAATISALRLAYRTLFRSKLSRQEAVQKVREEAGQVPEVMEILKFIETSERGVTV